MQTVSCFGLEFLVNNNTQFVTISRVSGDWLVIQEWSQMPEFNYDNSSWSSDSYTSDELDNFNGQQNSVSDLLASHDVNDDLTKQHLLNLFTVIDPDDEFDQGYLDLSLAISEI